MTKVQVQNNFQTVLSVKRALPLRVKGFLVKICTAYTSTTRGVKLVPV